MVKGPRTDETIGTVALLGDKNRWRLYELVAASREPVGRDEAATSLGLSRELAAFHLDRLVAGGLLEAEYRRRNGRSGPGAGRPAKLYRRSEREVTVSLPRRSYEIAANRFADALAQMDGTTGADALADVARAEGSKVGADARLKARARSGYPQRKAALLDLLEASGFEPELEPSGGIVRLRNCPYRSLASSHRDLTCGMNQAWAEGVLAGLEDDELEVGLAPTPGRCCVVFHERSGRATE